MHAVSRSLSMEVLCPIAAYGGRRRARSLAISSEMTQLCLTIIAAVATVLATTVFMESPLVGVGIVLIVAATWASVIEPTYWYRPAYYYPVYVPDHCQHNPRDGWMRHDRPSRLPDQA